MSKKMNLIIILCVAIFSSMTAFAHCDFGFKSDNKSYCFSVDWINGQTKQQGVYKNINQKSPVLNAAGLRPEKWIYSSATISVWESGDESHEPVFLENLVIYPYMSMPGGHSHESKSSFEYDLTKGKYLLTQMAFQEMQAGCWQLKLKVNETEGFQDLMNLESFTNLDAIGNYNQTVMCSLCSTPNSGIDGHTTHKH